MDRHFTFSLSLSHVEGQASHDGCTLLLCPLCALKSLKLSLYTIPPLPFIFLSKVHPCPSPDGRFLPIKQWNIFINNFNEFSYSQISFYQFFIFLSFLILFFSIISIFFWWLLQFYSVELRRIYRLYNIKSDWLERS